MGVGRSVCSWQLAESQSVHARARLSMISQARRLAGSQAARHAAVICTVSLRPDATLRGRSRL